MEKIFIARVFAYETPGENAKGKASVGVSVASRLNGNALLVGSYCPRENDTRKVGFLTSPQKFESMDEAKAHAQKLEKVFLRGAQLNPREWEWGEPDEESSMETGGNVYHVRFCGHDLMTDPRAARVGREEVVYEGKVVEPV